VIDLLYSFSTRLITIASNRNPPLPERPKIFHKRQSLREKRQGRHTPERPASDSNISYATHSELAAPDNRSASQEYPEIPGDVSDWVRRRSEATREPPRPMQVLLHGGERQNIQAGYESDENLYELDAGPSATLEANGNAVPPTDPLGDWRGSYAEQSVAQSNVDDDLARVMELSQQEAFLSPRRTNTGGFDVDQIAEAVNRSLKVTH
jgi:hypothetical protein